MGAMNSASKSARKVGILVVGTIVVLVGIALLPLPGPGMVVIILGLVILAQEFDWAQRWLDLCVERAASALGAVQESKVGKACMAITGIAMIIGGIVVCVVFTQWIVAGISFVIAGVVSLTTLHPRVQAWINEKALYGIDGEDDIPAR